MTPIDNLIDAIRTSRRLSRVRACYGRIVRIKGDGPLTLTEEPDRRVVMIMGPAALADLTGRSGIEMLSLIGYTDEYVRRKLKEGCRFELVVFSRPRGKLAVANWSNTIDGIIEAYPEVADIVAVNRRLLTALSLADFEALAGFSFAHVDARGVKDPRFMTLERLQKSDRSALAARRFLYHVTRLSDLFTGNGVTMTAYGEPGVREYIMRNRPVSQLENVQVIELQVW